MYRHTGLCLGGGGGSLLTKVILRLQLWEFILEEPSFGMGGGSFISEFFDNRILHIAVN